MAKVPYMIVVGDKEQEEGTVAVRLRDTTATTTMKVDEFVDMICNDIATKGKKD